jgi:hypothetical protein
MKADFKSMAFRGVLGLGLFWMSFGVASAFAADETPTVQATSSSPAVRSVPMATPEDWKGPLSDRDWEVGGIAGLALVEPNYGIALQAQISKRLFSEGWVEDITNPVSIEMSAGPAFVKGHSPFILATQLRWDFERDQDWTLFAVGGLGAQFTGPELGDRSLVHLRFGVGAFKRLDERLRLRMEASHEVLGVGVTYAL